MNSVWELFVHELRDMLNAENLLVHVLGEQARECSHEDLQQAFTEHRHQTERHAERLVDIFREIGETPEQADCKGIQGLKQEKQTLMKENPSKDLLDFINVAAGIKAERYEISAYESLISLAQQLGAERSVQLLRQNLADERETLAKLERFAHQVKPSNLGVRVSPEGGLPRKAA